MISIICLKINKDSITIFNQTSLLSYFSNINFVIQIHSCYFNVLMLRFYLFLYGKATIIYSNNN